MEFTELNPETLEKAAGMLKAIAHPVRIKIVGYLDDGRKQTVSDIHNSQLPHIIWGYSRIREFSLQRGKEKTPGTS